MQAVDLQSGAFTDSHYKQYCFNFNFNLICTFILIYFVGLFVVFITTNIANTITMLKEEIGIEAGLVWTALDGGELNVRAIKKLTKLAEKDLNLALGWLAREGKVNFHEVNGELLVSQS